MWLHGLLKHNALQARSSHQKKIGLKLSH